MRRRYRFKRCRRRVGRGIPKIKNGKIYFGRGQRGGGGLSALVSKLVYNIGDAIGIYRIWLGQKQLQEELYSEGEDTLLNKS